MILALHRKTDKAVTKTAPCIICDNLVYLSGYGVDTSDERVKAVSGDKAMGVECLAQIISKYGEFVIGMQQELTTEEKIKLRNLEVSSHEYLDELEKMVEITKGNKRIGFLIGWLHEVARLGINENPDSLMKQFVKDMNELSGIKP